MRWMLLALLLLSFGCWPQGGDELPGELIGQFEVVGLMVEQSCGAAIPAQDPLNLAFELRLEENGRAFYRQPSGATFAGTGSDGEYTFSVSQSWMVVQPDQFRGFVGCSVTQRSPMPRNLYPIMMKLAGSVKGIWKPWRWISIVR